MKGLYLTIAFFCLYRCFTGIKENVNGDDSVSRLPGFQRLRVGPNYPHDIFLSVASYTWENSLYVCSKLGQKYTGASRYWPFDNIDAWAIMSAINKQIVQGKYWFPAIVSYSFTLTGALDKTGYVWLNNEPVDAMLWAHWSDGYSTILQEPDGSEGCFMLTKELFDGYEYYYLSQYMLIDEDCNKKARAVCQVPKTSNVTDESNSDDKTTEDYPTMIMTDDLTGMIMAESTIDEQQDAPTPLPPITIEASEVTADVFQPEMEITTIMEGQIPGTIGDGDIIATTVIEEGIMATPSDEDGVMSTEFLMPMSSGVDDAVSGSDPIVVASPPNNVGSVSLEVAVTTIDPGVMMTATASAITEEDGEDTTPTHNTTRNTTAGSDIDRRQPINKNNVIVEVCPCKCTNTSRSIQGHDQAQMNQLMTEIKDELLVDSLNTSSFIRKKTSAMDDRVTAHVAGMFGICFILVFIGAIVAVDVQRLCIKNTLSN